MHLTLAAHSDFHPFTEGVHHGNAHTVQTTGNLVTTGAELAASVQHGEHRFQGTLAGAGMHIGGNAPTVIGHRC